MDDWRAREMPETMARLAERGGEGKVRTLVADVLRYGLGERDLSHEFREACYLVAVLNSSVVLSAVEPMQPKGQGGARHFDNLMWELRIPEYDGKQKLHRDLASAAARAEAVAASVPIGPAAHVTRQRRALRDALAADGVMARIDTLVATLLAG
jgi:hypothetical protein